MPGSTLNRRPLRVSRVWLLPALTLLFAACGGDGPSDPGPPPATLVVPVEGLPTGVPASVTVSGPGGFTRAISATTTITSLTAGSYTIAVTDVADAGSMYTASPPTQSVNLVAGTTVTASTVSYALATGTLAISMGGLPSSTPASIAISGPDGYARTVTEPTNIVGLKPGTYSIVAQQVRLTSATYDAFPGTLQVQVLATTTPSTAHISYALASGSMALTINGLPQGSTASITVTGPANYSATVTQSSTLENLTPGLYTIASGNVSAGSNIFIGSPATQQVAITATPTASQVGVFYTSAGTSLSVQIQGLPSPVPAKVTVSGPNGYTASVTSTRLLAGIPAGTYTITSADVSASCSVYTAAPAAQTVSVTAGLSTSTSVSYGGGGAGMNLCIDGAYVTQAIQTYDNSVPLVAGRNALLRVFVRASGANTAQPSVRVRFYNGPALVNTITITAPTFSVPLLIDEAAVSASWNAQLPGSLLQPGLRMLVDVDPGNAVVEGNENDNVLPADGSPAALDVRAVPPLNVRLIPVIQSARGDTGRINESNKASFILPMERMFPVATIDADIRQPYLFNGAELGSSGANWTSLLGEINALRVAEGSERIYYGIVRVGYASGVAGLGYIGVPAALGWDHAPSGHEVLAHELGHNFNRLHAPCGNPALVDPSYPHAGATVGVFGYDITSGAHKSPNLRDLMSYCDPAWISDYNYRAILNFRAQSGQAVARTTSAAQRGLLVWGRIDQGRVVLEPAFEVDAPATLPARGGPHRLDGFGPSGEALFSLNFAGNRVADSPDPNDETFAFVIPMSQLRGVDLNRLRLSALGRQVEQRGTGRGAVPSAQRTAPGRVRISWDVAASRAAMIRDGRTGQILSFGRSGAVDVPTASDDLDITLSDGVRSVRSRIRPR